MCKEPFGKRKASRVNLGQHLVGFQSPNTVHDAKYSQSTPADRYSYGIIVLVGPSCEVPAKVERAHVDCQALLNTGAMVRSLNLCVRSWGGKYIHCRISVEGAGGHSLKYLGYIIAKSHMSDLEQGVDAIFLVVSDIGYNCTNPVLIGTYILQHTLAISALSISMPFCVQVKECPDEGC